MSIHEVKVVRVDNIEKHSNADALELIKIWDYTCVVAKGQFKVGDLVAYIEPDYVVDTSRSEFRFLAKTVDQGGIRVTSYGKHRITVKRLRGIFSSGLLIPAPFGSSEGDNVMDKLEITRWEPGETKMTSGAGGSLGSSSATKGPQIVSPHYDLNNLRKYGKTLDSNEEIIATTKIHGTNARFVYSDGEMFVGSRNTWKKQPGYYFRGAKRIFVKFLLTMFKFFFNNNAEKTFAFIMKMPFKWMRRLNPIITQYVGPNAWWEAYKQNPWIGEWCRNHPNVVLYGEVFGPSVQGQHFHYGLKEHEIGFLVFDILKDGHWVPNTEFEEYDCSCNIYQGLKFVPTVYRGPYDLEVIANLAEEKETYNNAGHVREGIVVKVINERYDDRIGRVALKYVSNAYLMKS